MYDKFISFLKEHGLYNQEAMDYIKDKTYYINYDGNESNSFFGCFPIMEGNIVKDIRLCVPKMIDDITVSINIHEYVHLTKIYNHLNKKYIESKYEDVLPMAYEFLYLMHNDPEYLDYYIEKVKSGDDDILKLFVTFYEGTNKLLSKKKQ